MLEVKKQSEITRRIFIVREKEVMLDRDLAELYNIIPTRLREQVKRNIDRFPEDFMFQIDEREIDYLVSQNAIPSRQHLGGSLPYVFTEQGLYMLASVLKSTRAIEVNISIIRTFTKLREFSLQYDAVARKVMEMEREYDSKFDAVFDYLNRIISETHEGEDKIMGFIRDEN